jgi:hypothetical protein
MTERRLPQFVVVGAIKAATTWTSRQLARNPGVFIPGPEPHYFSTEYERGPDWYRSLFAEAAQRAVIGEKSADYLSHREAASRMSKMLPQAKIVVQLRNPVERAYSDYCMLYRRGTLDRGPEAYFAEGAAERDRFLGGGLYAEHLGRFFDHFPSDQILTLLTEDIEARPEESLERISRHIGVTPHIDREALGRRENDSTESLLPLPIRKALKPFKDAVRPFRGARWFEAARGALAKPVKYPPLSGTARGFLANYYRKDIVALGEMIGRDLSSWLEQDNAAGSGPPHRKAAAVA